MTPTPLLRRLDAICRNAFEKMSYDSKYGEVRVSDHSALADFQCNGLLAVAKIRRSNPEVIAQPILEELKNGRFFTVEFLRPGFLNFRITDATLKKHVLELTRDDRCFVEKTTAPARFLLDYGGPNLAKEMHVGHLRSCIVGQALNTILTFVGHETISDVHLGDWGLQMGQLISQIEDERPELLKNSGNAAFDMADLQAWYPRASARAKEDEAFLDRARRATAMLQAGNTEYIALWRKVVDVSKRSLNRDFGRLGVHFDLWHGESRYQSALDRLVDRLVDAGKAEHDHGAIIIRMPEQESLPPLILRNSKGGYGYGATDLATIEERVTVDKPDFILYVVDARQKMHFRQVFTAAEICGLLGRAQAEHIAFGTVNGPDGKPFKTRAGGVMRLHDLLEIMSGSVRERLKATSVAPEDHAEVAEQIATAAIKFGELSHDRESNYVFDMEQFLKFEGRTGPYIQYTCVRIRSLIANAADAGFRPGSLSILGEGGRELVLCLDEMPAHIQRAIEARKPSFIANHVYSLANLINSFYHANRVLADDVERDAAESYLTVLCAALTQLELCMILLGLSIPKAM